MELTPQQIEPLQLVRYRDQSLTLTPALTLTLTLTLTRCATATSPCSDRTTTTTNLAPMVVTLRASKACSGPSPQPET